MTRQELEDKFRGLASRALPDKRVEGIMQTVREIEKIKDISELSSMLPAAGKNPKSELRE